MCGINKKTKTASSQDGLCFFLGNTSNALPDIIIIYSSLIASTGGCGYNGEDLVLASSRKFL